VLPVFRGTREVSRPLAFVPEDRTTEGLIPDLSVTENVVLGPRAFGELGEERPTGLESRARAHGSD
jgi:ABC-type sugar transport system ATPase subunit